MMICCFFHTNRNIDNLVKLEVLKIYKQLCSFSSLVAYAPDLIIFASLSMEGKLMSSWIFAVFMYCLMPFNASLKKGLVHSGGLYIIT